MENRRTTAISDLFLGDDGILEVVLKEGAVVDLANLETNFLCYKELLGNRNALLLIDARVNYRFTSEARKFASKPNGQLKRVAVAYLVGSIAGRWKTSLYVFVNKPQVPTRIFTNREKALAWLNSFCILPGERSGRKVKKR